MNHNLVSSNVNITFYINSHSAMKNVYCNIYKSFFRIFKKVLQNVAILQKNSFKFGSGWTRVMVFSIADFKGTHIVCFILFLQ